MKKQRMMGADAMTFRQGCEAYFLNCRQRNLREGTINHYRQSYRQFYKQIDPDMPLGSFNVKVYEGFVNYLMDTLDNAMKRPRWMRLMRSTGVGSFRRCNNNLIDYDH